MNKIFSDLKFWNLFIFLEREDIDFEEIESQVELVAENFKIGTEKNKFKHDGQTFEEDFRVIIFEFDFSEDYMLQLEYIPRAEGSGKYLYLKNYSTNEKQLMGWWDLDAWHPYCLKEDELIKISELLKNKKDSIWYETKLPLLLLHDFVGFDNPDKADKFANKIFKTFESLNIEGFKQAATKPIAIFYLEEEKYRWISDPEIGWTFESKVYNCYSLRNKAHSKGEEKGRFPFEDWKNLMSKII
jgi:hypothetical protein